MSLSSLACLRLCRLLLRSGLLVLVSASLLLGGCSQIRDTARKAAGDVGDAATTAATGAAQQALGPALAPVIELLRQGSQDLKVGNLSAAVTAMGGFAAVWDKAAPVIRPLAGDRWPALESAANTVSTTLAPGATPDAAAARTAITALMAALQALAGKTGS